MSKFGGLGTGSVVGLGGLAVIGVVLAALWFRAQPAPPPETPPVVETATAPAPALPDPVPTPRMPETPTFDTFRLEPGGQMIIAGQAEPGSQVSILLDDVNIGSVLSDNAGKFVQFLDLPTSTAPRVLSLRARSEASEQELASQDEIIIAPTPTVVSGASNDTPTVNYDPQATEKKENYSQQATEAQGGTQPSQTVLLTNETGIRVLQSPSAETPPEVMATVALDAITYSLDGEVELSGRAQGNGFVRIYLDNDPVVTSPVSPAGDWTTALPEVDTGIYTLRVDEVDAAGAVTSRVETPFKREDQAALSASQTAESIPIRAITVQPGSTLWAISREAYGEGVLYVRVFEANRDRIRDPDLIYPGQVFALP
ncbi:MAG: LysM peptidoglycan-binding domain-containing protein [Roseovarius sp.]